MYRINDLIKFDRKLYHTSDLALLWGIKNKNTLYTTIKRYLQKGILIPIFKGFYSTVPLTQLDPLELGKSIVHQYAYLSTESVLAENGIISQTVHHYTFVSGVSKMVQIGGFSFRYRKLKDAYLVNPAGIEKKNNTFVATPARAIADLLYFDPRYHFDMREAIDWQKVDEIKKEVGYK